MRVLKIMLFISLIVIPLAAQSSYDQQLAEGFYLRAVSVPIHRDLIRVEAEKLLPRVLESFERSFSRAIQPAYHNWLVRVIYDKLREEIPDAACRAVMLPVINSQFNPAELEQVNSFFRTEAGAKYQELYGLESSNSLLDPIRVKFQQLSERGDFIDRVVQRYRESEICGYAKIDYTWDDDEFVSGFQYPESVSEKLWKSDDPVKFVPWDWAPVPLDPILPIYPEQARLDGIEGTVVLDVEILANGSIREIRVLRSVQPGPGGIDEAAIKAVRRVRFQPGIAYDRTCNTTLIVPVKFRLD